MSPQQQHMGLGRSKEQQTESGAASAAAAIEAKNRNESQRAPLPSLTKKAPRDEGALLPACQHQRAAAQFSSIASTVRHRHLARYTEGRGRVSHLLRAPGDCIIEIALFLPLQDVRSLLGTCKSVAGYLGNAAGRDFWATLAATRLLSRPDLSSMNGACCSATWFRALLVEPNEKVARIDSEMVAAKNDIRRLRAEIRCVAALLDEDINRKCGNLKWAVLLGGSGGFIALGRRLLQVVVVPLLAGLDTIAQAILCSECGSRRWLIPLLSALGALAFAGKGPGAGRLVMFLCLVNVALWMVQGLTCSFLFDAAFSCGTTGEGGQADIPGSIVSTTTAATDSLLSTALSDSILAEGTWSPIAALIYLPVALLRFVGTLLYWVVFAAWILIRHLLGELGFPLIGPILVVMHYLLLNWFFAAAVTFVAWFLVVAIARQSLLKGFLEERDAAFRLRTQDFTFAVKARERQIASLTQRRAAALMPKPRSGATSTPAPPGTASSTCAVM